MTFSIKQVWIFAAVDKDGNEGVIGETIGDYFMPYVCADEVRMNQLKPRAKDLSRSLKMPVRLIKLTQREDLEVYNESAH